MKRHRNFIDIFMYKLRVKRTKKYEYKSKNYSMLVDSFMAKIESQQTA